MKKLLTKQVLLKELSKDIRVYSNQIKAKIHQSADATPPLTKNTPTKSQKEHAAKTIQKIWRGKKIKETVVKSPYFSYLSMIDPDDEFRQLSTIMFGRHVAEIRLGARERIDNPILNTREFYHRSIDLSSILTDTLFKEFEIPNFNVDEYAYTPLTDLKSNPIEEVIDLFRQEVPNLKIFKKESYSVVILAIPRDSSELSHIKEKVKNMGLVASSWELTENLKTSLNLEQGKETTKVKIDPDLPKTKEELLNSSIIIKLNAIATSARPYPTKILAKCLQKLLKDLPPTVDSKSIQRVALLLDLTNTFYSYNYPRYALCVYSILHEISLNLLRNKDRNYLEQEYQHFQKESSDTLNRILGTNEKQTEHSTLITAATTSGIGACVIAMRLASKMKIKDGGAPKVMIFKPCYYELPNISMLKKVENSEDADILLISAGPIVNPEGLTPGVNINQFVRRHVINKKRTKPISIIIDATTALYRNLQLDDDIKNLVMEGKVSLIVHESHQKFGLLHSDQAQYGRVFGWCSKSHFHDKDLIKLHTHSKEDFYNHLDTQIGAFVSTRCKRILEDIKERHFTNGAILRNLLINTSLISNHVEKHEDMLKNFNELYFLNDKETAPDSYTSRLEKAAFGVIDYRASFGHYTPSTTGVVNQRRFSPDASDDLDVLVQACHIRLSQDHLPSALLYMLIDEARTKNETLTLEEQIVTIGMLHNIISNVSLIPHTFGEICVISGQPTEKEKKRVLDSQKNPKDLLFIKTPTGGVQLGYSSYDNQFKLVEVKNTSIIAMVKLGTISNPNNIHAITSYLQTLQIARLPKHTNFAVVYSAMQNALECCPLLRQHQYFLNIHIWLSAVKEKIIQQYNPEKKQLFLDTVHALYSMNVPLKDTELDLLSQYPEICKYIKRNQDNPDIAKIVLSLMMSGKPLDKLSYLLNKKSFIDAIYKIHKGNAEILNALSNSPVKFKNASDSSKTYIQTCYTALFDFHLIDNPNEKDKQELIHSIKGAAKEYSKVLSTDRSKTSQLVRSILKAITNFIAALTFGAAHYIHYKTTGNIIFFSETNSEKKLKTLHKEVEKDLESLTISNKPTN